MRAHGDAAVTHAVLNAPRTASVDALRWARGDAIWMLGLLVSAWLVDRVWLAALGGVASLVAWVWTQRASFGAARGFGAANLVTSLRVVLLLALALAFDAEQAPVAAGCGLLIFTLDGFDGWLARRLNQVSDFGATYDANTDASFVLVASLGLAHLGRAPAWVLIAGGLRYAYVLALWVARRERVQTPRSRWGRHSFGISVTAFVLSIWPLVGWTPGLPACATLLLAASFARSWLLSLRAPADVPLAR